MTSKNACPICGDISGGEQKLNLCSVAWCSRCAHAWTSHNDFGYDYASDPMIAVQSEKRLLSVTEFLNGVRLEGRKTLEIGCATGAMAEFFKATYALGPYDGIEPSPGTADTKVFRQVVRGIFNPTSMKDLDPPYSLIIMQHVLEHMPDPRSAMALVYESLAEDGIALIEVPHRAGHPGFRFEENPAHEHFFSVQSLVELLAGEGLEVLKIQTDLFHNERCVDAMFTLVRRHDGHYRPLDHICGSTLQSASASKIVVYGAGMPSLAEIEQYLPRNSICAVYDSNPQLWGSRRSGYLIEPPSPAEIAQANLLFINSISFENEIRQAVDAMADDVPQILTLREVLLRVDEEF